MHTLIATVTDYATGTRDEWSSEGTKVSPETDMAGEGEIAGTLWMQIKTESVIIMNRSQKGSKR